MWGLLTLSVAACAAQPDGSDGQETVDPGGDSAGGKADSAFPGTFHRLELDWAAVPAAPGRPNVIAYVPAAFDASEGVNVIVYLHGWYNCAENLTRKTNGPCVAGRAPRQAYDLPGQLERSGKNAILLLPQLAYDQALSEAFAFAEDNTFFYMVWDALWTLDLDVWDVRQVIVASHSGGYKAAAAILTAGGMTVNELWLLDSLYGAEATFDGWLEREAARFPDERRFVNLYTSSTSVASTAMAARAKGFEVTVVDDRAPGRIKTREGVHFKRSSLEHDPLVRTAIEDLLSTSKL